MKSILQEQKECWFCGKQFDLHLHHIYPGANRKVSDKNGFVVYLCAYHHNLGGNGNCVHQCKRMDIELRRACQKKFEETHSKRDFVKLIGRNYL